MTVSSALTPQEEHVAVAMAKNGKQLDIAEIGRDTAMSQDAGIDGIDVWEFVCSLGDDYRMVWRQVPWERFSDQRASFYGCSVLVFPFWLLLRILTWPIHREAPIPAPRRAEERLTVGHLAALLERGEWFEPKTVE